MGPAWPPRCAGPEDLQACLALAVLNQDRHAQLGLAPRGHSDFWRWRLGEAAANGPGACKVIGTPGARWVEAWRLVVSEEDVPRATPGSPDGAEAGAAGTTSEGTYRAVVGMLLGVVTGPVGADGQTRWLQCRIDNAYVRPRYRRRGHTGRMVGFLAAWAKSLGVERIDLQVGEANPSGVAAWTALGFRLTGEPVQEGFLGMRRG